MFSSTPQFEAALEIVRTLRAAGYEAYFAGGCVRDLLLGREPSDYDVATSATPGIVLDMFPRTFAVGAHFGVVLVSAATGDTVSQRDVTEVATFRSDGVYSDGRHPDAVKYTTSAREDVQRRDFTINGLLLDPLALDLCPPGSPKEHHRCSLGNPTGQRGFLAQKRDLDLTDKDLSVGTPNLGHPAVEGPGSSPYVSSRQKEGALVPETADKEHEASGHDLSRAVNAPQSTRALAPEGSSAEDASEEATAGPSTPSASLRSLRMTELQGDNAPCSAQDDSAGLGPPCRSAQDDSALSDDSAKVRVLRSAVIDHVGGVADLDAGVVRAIGRAELRFEEDRLRMLRAVRFAARLGFELETGTAAAIRRLAAGIHAVSRERVRDELTKMLTEGHARRAFELLDATGLLAEVLPEIARMKGVQQPPQFHPEGDVWIHTLMLLDQLDAGCPLTLGWGALLHDVGKPPTFRVAERIRFDGHVEVGVAMGAEICRRFRFSNDETHQILALIENHMRFASAQKMKESTLKRFFRLESFDQHLALHRMDCMASHGGLESWEFVRERFNAMPEETVRPQPLITGRELIAAGYQPGPQFKEMLHAVEDAQLEGHIATQEEAMRLIRERFAQSKS